MKNKPIIKSQGAFTLIELLVAIAMVGLLAAGSLSLINPSEQFKKGRDAQRKQDLRQLQNALDTYQTDNNRYPAADGQQIQGAAWGGSWQPYMTKVPKDPLSPTQDYYYQTTSDGNSYSLYAKFEKCPDAQTIPGADCSSYNYSVTSSNIAVAILITPSPSPTPTLTPTPTLSYKRAFVTSQIYTANLGGLAGADTKCQDRANAVSLGGAWKAWLSDSTNSPSTRFTQATIPYKLVDGTLIANNWTDLIDGSLNNPISKTESNGMPPSSNGTGCDFFAPGLMVWTATVSNGSTDPNSINSCSGWTAITNDSGFGNRSSSSSLWTDYCGSSSCSGSAPLYCFEQ